MTSSTIRILMTLAAVILLAVGIGFGRWWATAAHDHSAPASSAAPTAGTAERDVLYWYDPMVPDQHFDKPGRSPFMDMELVPKYADTAIAGGVRIDPGIRQNLGIRVATVERGRLATSLHVPGTLAWDRRLERVVSARSDGIATRVAVKAPFTHIQRGDALVTLLSPDWMSALAEARSLDHATSPAARQLRQAAQQRLRVLGVPRGASTGEGGVAVHALHDGIVTEVLVREGQSVSAGAPLFRLNGTATLWLEAAIPQAYAAQLAAGSPATVQIEGMAGQGIRAHVDTLLPQVDIASRTRTARIVLDNPDGVLAAGMFADVTLEFTAGASVPLLPTEALIATGSESRVIVEDGDDRYVPVRVQTGRSAGGRTEILAGLEGGEKVVVSGQFLIDSEASLSGLDARLSVPQDGHEHAAHPHTEPTANAAAVREHAAAPANATAHEHDPPAAGKETAPLPHDHANHADHQP